MKSKSGWPVNILEDTGLFDGPMSVAAFFAGQHAQHDSYQRVCPDSWQKYKAQWHLGYDYETRL